MFDVKRYKVIDFEGDVRVIYRDADYMKPFVKMGLAVQTLATRGHPWDKLYDGRDPLYGNWLSDPELDYQQLKDQYEAYPNLIKGKQAVDMGMLTSTFGTSYENNMYRAYKSGNDVTENNVIENLIKQTLKQQKPRVKLNSSMTIAEVSKD